MAFCRLIWRVSPSSRMAMRLFRSCVRSVQTLRVPLGRPRGLPDWPGLNRRDLGGLPDWLGLNWRDLGGSRWLPSWSSLMSAPQVRADTTANVEKSNSGSLKNWSSSRKTCSFQVPNVANWTRAARQRSHGHATYLARQQAPVPRSQMFWRLPLAWQSVRDYASVRYADSFSAGWLARIQCAVSNSVPRRFLSNAMLIKFRH